MLGALSTTCPTLRGAGKAMKPMPNKAATSEKHQSVLLLALKRDEAPPNTNDIKQAKRTLFKKTPIPTTPSVETEKHTNTRAPLPHVRINLHSIKFLKGKRQL